MTRTVFTGGVLYDGTRGTPAEGDLVIEDGRVVAVGTGMDGDEEVDCSGHWLSPGFFDCHVHVMFERPDYLQILQTPFSLSFYQAAINLRATLDTGVTSIRDASGADLGVKEAVARGLIPGPRMQISISMLSQTGGHGDAWQACGSHVPLFPPHPGRPSGIVDGPDEVRRRVRELVRAGADVVKVATTGGVLSTRDDPRHSHFRDAEIAVIVEEATAAGLFVMAHAQGAAGIKTAIRHGVRSIEHGVFLDDEAVEMMLAAGTWLVPTMHAPRAVLQAAEEGAAIPQAAIDKTLMLMDAHQESVQRAHEAGVRIAMGTDCGVGRHGTNLDELTLMMGAGLTAVDALHATTGSAAELLGVAEDRGTLAPGMRADLVVIEGSPGELTDLRRRIRDVYLDGVRVAPVGTGPEAPPAR
jgi:imidazolonepropionase-like amidohydrolase